MGRPYLQMSMLGRNQAMPRMVACGNARFLDRRRAGMERVKSLVSGLSLIVESRLKQKMQTWHYSPRRTPRVYLEQAPSRTPLACSAEPTGSRRERFFCVPPKAGQSPEEGKNGE
jgi:hypothetical protein